MDNASFIIQNTAQIISHLALLEKNKCLLTAQFGDTHQSFITAIIHISKKTLSVILDYGPKQYLNQQILSAAQITFTSEFNGIKVAFTGSALRKITYVGEPAFSMPLPSSLFWMQRREFYRIKSPLSKASYCQLMLPDQDPLALKLHDISLSGFAMLNTTTEASGLFLPTSHFNQCKLILADAGSDNIAFEVRHKITINTGKQGILQKIGCKFTGLSPSFESVIQRYMQQIERENR
jgi:flagellar brake protein